MQVATPTYYPIPDAFRMAVVSSRRRCIPKFTLPTAKPLPVVANAAPTILRLAIAGHLIALKLSCQLLYLLRLYLLPILPARRSCPLDAFASHVSLRHQTFRRPQGISTSPRLSTQSVSMAGRAKCPKIKVDFQLMIRMPRLGYGINHVPTPLWLRFQQPLLPHDARVRRFLNPNLEI
jgi:hypothetical protein